MEYSITQVAKMAGVSARTLRYYDEIDLLKPLYVNAAGYRFYGTEQLDLLQQILFYREQGLALQQIRKILYRPDFCLLEALEDHLLTLEQRQRETAALIDTVKKTIATVKGEYAMQDHEKFEAFKKETVQQQEAMYGAEVRQAYGDSEAEASQKKFLQMTPAQYERFQQLEQEILTGLEQAVQNGETAEGAVAQHLVWLHKEWLSMTWSQYTPQAHQGVAALYVADERFQQYYDQHVPGCAMFLEAAVRYWTGAGQA